MDIGKIDRNMNQAAGTRDGMRFYTLPCEPFKIYGVRHGENGFYRLDPEFAASISEGVKFLATNTAGGRVRFKTNSKKLKAIVKYRNFCCMGHMPLTGSSGLSVVDVTRREWKFMGSIRPERNDEHGYEGSVNLSGEMHEYVLWMPLYNDVDELTIGLDEDAVVEKGHEYGYDGKPIVYYGSSITQGACASRPDNSYEALISKFVCADFVNLGFSGNAKGEPELARYAASLNPLAFVIDYDHNAPDAEYLKNTHYKFYRAFRKENKTTPVIFVSRPDVERDPSCAARKAVIKESYRKAKAAGDEVYFVDGSEMFIGKMRENCTVDGCHPTDFGFFRMAVAIGGMIFDILYKRGKREQAAKNEQAAKTAKTE